MKNSSWKSDSKRFVILRLFQKESLHYIYHTKYTGRSRSELDPASDATVAPLNEVLNFQLALRLQQAVVVNQAAPSSWQWESMVALGSSQMILCAALWYLITALLRERVNVPWINNWLDKNLIAVQGSGRFVFMYLFRWASVHHPLVWLTEHAGKCFRQQVYFSNCFPNLEVLMTHSQPT